MCRSSVDHRHHLTKKKLGFFEKKKQYKHLITGYQPKSPSNQNYIMHTHTVHSAHLISIDRMFPIFTLFNQSTSVPSFSPSLPLSVRTSYPMEFNGFIPLPGIHSFLLVLHFEIHYRKRCKTIFSVQCALWISRFQNK